MKGMVRLYRPCDQNMQRNNDEVRVVTHSCGDHRADMFARAPFQGCHGIRVLRLADILDLFFVLDRFHFGTFRTKPFFCTSETPYIRGATARPLLVDSGVQSFLANLKSRTCSW